MLLGTRPTTAGESNNSEKKDENLIIQNHCEQPYFIWANQLIFELFQKESHIRSTVAYLYGLSQMVSLKEYFVTNKFDQMKVCIISNENRKKLLSNALKELAELNMNNIKELFNEACKKLIKRNATNREKNIFGYHYSRLITEKFQNNIKDAFIKAIILTFNIKE